MVVSCYTTLSNGNVCPNVEHGISHAKLSVHLTISIATRSSTETSKSKIFSLTRLAETSNSLISAYPTCLAPRSSSQHTAVPSTLPLQSFCEHRLTRVLKSMSGVWVSLSMSWSLALYHSTTLQCPVCMKRSNGAKLPIQRISANPVWTCYGRFLSLIHRKE